MQGICVNYQHTKITYKNCVILFEVKNEEVDLEVLHYHMCYISSNYALPEWHFFYLFFICLIFFWESSNLGREKWYLERNFYYYYLFFFLSQPGLAWNEGRKMFLIFLNYFGNASAGVTLKLYSVRIFF